jgi:hypothetical protein
VPRFLRNQQQRRQTSGSDERWSDSITLPRSLTANGALLTGRLMHTAYRWFSSASVALWRLHSLAGSLRPLAALLLLVCGSCQCFSCCQPALASAEQHRPYTVTTGAAIEIAADCTCATVPLKPKLRVPNVNTGGSLTRYKGSRGGHTLSLIPTRSQCMHRKPSQPGNTFTRPATATASSASAVARTGGSSATTVEDRKWKRCSITTRIAAGGTTPPRHAQLETSDNTAHCPSL